MINSLLLSGICGVAISSLLLLGACQEKPEAALHDPVIVPAPAEAVKQKQLVNLSVSHSQHQGVSALARQIPVSRQPIKAAPNRLMVAATNKGVRNIQTPFPVRRCMNMGNALESPNEGEWGYSIRAQDFRVVANAGFDTVRIPVRWDVHTSPQKPYAIDRQFMARVQKVVAQAQASGLGVIIDVHHYEGLMGNTDTQEDRFLAIWEQIAFAFSGASSRVYFEILNEPTLEISAERLNAIYDKVVPLIRHTNPRRKLIMGGNSWNSLETLASVRWPQDANIVATFHDYGPHEFTHQGAPWMKPFMPMGRRWGEAKDITELNYTYNLAKEFKLKTGMPVFVGEFGVIDKVPQTQRNQWIKARRKSMETAGLSWCAWDYAGAFKSYDTEAERWLPGVLDAYTGR